MANAGVPKGKLTQGKGVGVSAKMVNNINENDKNEMGIPASQSPGINKGNKELSMNQLPSTARVVKPASSNLMSGMSQSRGAGGAK